MTLTPPNLPDLWHNPCLSSIITDIIHKMMKKSPKDRYPFLFIITINNYNNFEIININKRNY